MKYEKQYNFLCAMHELGYAVALEMCDHAIKVIIELPDFKAIELTYNVRISSKHEITHIIYDYEPLPLKKNMLDQLNKMATIELVNAINKLIKEVSQ